MIPTFHCTNFAAAVYITLYDMLLKTNSNAMASEMLKEKRWCIK